MKLKILKDLYALYYYNLIDTGILVKALKTLPADELVEIKITSLGQGIPAMREEIKVADRLKKLQVDEKFLIARVGALREAMIELVGSQEKFEELEKEIELPK